MEIRNSFEIPLPVDEAFRTLLDIRKIAPCFPGAELLEVSDARSFKGKVSVRLGPVALSFVGTARIENINDAKHSAQVVGQGSDAKGRGQASGRMSFAMAPSPNGTKVDVVTDIALAGAVAQYGRGVGMIQEVASQIVSQFAGALRQMLEREGAGKRSGGAGCSGTAAGGEADLRVFAASRGVLAVFETVVRRPRGSVTTACPDEKARLR